MATYDPRYRAPVVVNERWWVADAIATPDTTSLPSTPNSGHWGDDFFPPVSKGRAGLEELDARLGPVNLGSVTVSRVELSDMGARLNGQPIDPPNVQRHPWDNTFIDSLQFDAETLKRLIQSNAGAINVTGILFEAATQRANTAPSVLTQLTGLVQEQHLHSLGNLLSKAQTLPSTPVNASSPKMQPWVDAAKSHGLLTAGLGMQAFGIYSGINGIVSALKIGDNVSAGVNAGSVAAELNSLVLESAVTHLGKAYLKQGALSVSGFKASSIGRTCIRGGGLLGNVLTLPFDIYSAVKSFDDAAKSTSSKEAQDHYVAAGLSLTGAALSVALGAAAAAGFSATGPVGLVACGMLLLGANIYGAARRVEDLEQYIELSTEERWRSGWFAFTGQKLDESITNNYLVEKTRADYAKALESRAKTLLEGALKDTVSHIVNGTFDVELRPQKIWKFQWAADELPYSEVNTPTVESKDDIIDARDGPGEMAISLSGEPGNAKSILWQLDGGNDRVLGTLEKSNLFSYSNGEKNLTGGNREDGFLFQTEGLLHTQLPLASQQSYSHLDGGKGTDSLLIQGRISSDQPSYYAGHDIDLNAGTLSAQRSNRDSQQAKLAHLASIENVDTLQGGISRVTGTADANQITLNGADDIATGGAGDDVFWVKGNDCQITGEAGNDRYLIESNWGTVTIHEDATQSCTLELLWPMEQIQRWYIEGNALVIASNRGADGELTPRNIVVTNVYTQVGEQRQLLERTVLVHTQDGYALSPDLPRILETSADQDIGAIIVKSGTLRTAPALITGGYFPLPSAEHSAYFVSRGSPFVELLVSGQDSRQQCTLFIDYDSNEIDKVQAIYEVESEKNSTNTYLTYSDASLIIRLNDRSDLTIAQWAGQSPDRPTNVSGAIYSSGLTLHRDITLVFRDGKSYRLGLPADSYLEDSMNPGDRLIDSDTSLIERQGIYWFCAPLEAPATRLKAQPQRVELITSDHSNAVHVMYGASSTYELYPQPNVTLRLSTPGALAKALPASTWVFHVSTLPAGFDLNTIKIGKKQVWLGSVNVLLPTDDTPGLPQERVIVVLPDGSRHEIDFLFEETVLLEPQNTQ